jgi:hypothetical protein
LRTGVILFDDNQLYIVYEPDFNLPIQIVQQLNNEELNYKQLKLKEYELRKNRLYDIEYYSLSLMNGISNTDNYDATLQFYFYVKDNGKIDYVSYRNKVEPNQLGIEYKRGKLKYNNISIGDDNYWEFLPPNHIISNTQRGLYYSDGKDFMEFQFDGLKAIRLTKNYFWIINLAESQLIGVNLKTKRKSISKILNFNKFSLSFRKYSKYFEINGKYFEPILLNK